MKLVTDRPDDDEPAEIAGQALLFLAADAERLGTFLALSGLDPRRIREAARDPAFLVGVLDHLLNDEGLLLSFAAESGVRPQRVAEVRARMAGPQIH